MCVCCADIQNVATALLSTESDSIPHLLVTQRDFDRHSHQASHEDSQRIRRTHRTHLERPTSPLLIAIPANVIKRHAVSRPAHETFKADEDKRRGYSVRKEGDVGLQREKGEEDGLEEGRER